MRISNYTSVAGEKVEKIHSAITNINEQSKEGGIGKYANLSVFKSKDKLANKCKDELSF